MKTILIIGDRGCGKTTLIKALEKIKIQVAEFESQAPNRHIEYIENAKAFGVASQAFAASILQFLQTNQLQIMEFNKSMERFGNEIKKTSMSVDEAAFVMNDLRKQQPRPYQEILSPKEFGMKKRGIGKYKFNKH